MRIFFVQLYLTLAAISAFGQTFGEITGKVKGTSGAVVTGASVAAINPATGAARSAVTNEAGVYSFSLPATRYLQPLGRDRRIPHRHAR